VQTLLLFLAYLSCFDVGNHALHLSCISVAHSKSRGKKSVNIKHGLIIGALGVCAWSVLSPFTSEGNVAQVNPQLVQCVRRFLALSDGIFYPFRFV
jgi:hypothetical protein